MDKLIKNNKTVFGIWGILLFLLLTAELVGNFIMTGFGSVEVSNVFIENVNGLTVRGKLFVPESASETSPLPGIVYLHGYQNNRETSDPYAIELSRRGIVVLNIDTLGRGNSDNQFTEEDPDFDETYGGRSAFQYLLDLPFVDPDKCGIGGHSLGAEMAYTAALNDPAIQAIVTSGFAYDVSATENNPKNMLMLFGKYDEYRKRMTGTRNFELEWMNTEQTKAAFPVPHPLFDKTYGDFTKGSARRVHLTNTSHVGESFDPGAIAEGVDWFEKAFNLSNSIPVDRQIWRLKEISSLLAMLSALFSIIPLAIILMRLNFFQSLEGVTAKAYICTKKNFWKAVLTNGFLSLLYLPLILVIFAVHVYLVPIDRIFPMMMINGIVFWFLIINFIGYLFFRHWMKKEQQLHPENNYTELGISPGCQSAVLNRKKIGKYFILALILFGYIYFLQAGLEKIFLIDFRYKFPYASDLTPFRFLMFIEYSILFFFGYLQFNTFLQGQIRPAPRENWLKTSAHNSIQNILVIIIPLLIIMAIQYIPLFTTGFIPFTGPGGSLIGFVINLEHMCVLLIMMIILSTFMYNRTGNIYLGTFLNALIVGWMFTSSSVIAPLPI